MNEFKENNEESLVDFLEVLSYECPEILDLFYPMTAMANHFLYVFQDLLSENFDDFDYEYMNINDTLKLVQEFLNKCDQKYVLMFDEALNNGTFDIFHIDNLCEDDDRIDEPKCLDERKNVSINIPINYEISDGAIIIHEFFHYTNSDKDTIVRCVYTELISIYMELRYYQFLASKGYNIISYYKELYERINNIYISATNIAYTGSILDIYYNTGNIDHDSIMFMNKYRKIYKDNVYDLIGFSKDDTFLEGVCVFEYEIGYLLGGLIAINLLKETQINDLKIKYINDNIDKLSIKQILNLLEINIEEYPQLIDYCANIIEALEGVVYEENNSNSRSNSSRKNKVKCRTGQKI